MEWIIVASLNVLVITVCYILLRRYVDKRTSQNANLSEIRGQITKLIQELDETTERNIQIIEHRIEELKGLTRQSKKDIELLQNQREEYSNALENYRQLGRMENPLRKAEPPQEPGAETIVEDSEETQDKTPRQKVIEAHALGKSPGEISAELDIPQGEVELIIQMQQIRK